MLGYLREDPNVSVELQDTAFTKDALARYVCNTMPEVLAAGDRPFDVVIIGAGMFGAYLAEKLYRKANDQNLRILVLDAGSHLFSTHVQNLPRIGLNPPDAALVTQNLQDPGTRAAVWGIPWHSNEPFTGLAYCVGGRSLFWGGWAPRMTAADLARWPSAVRTYLDENYEDVEAEIGVKDKADYLSGKLNHELHRALVRAAAKVPSVTGVEDAPLAVQASQPGSGLFSFDKYSSVPLLYEAIRDDVARRWTANDNSRRRLFLVPKTHVVRLGCNAGRVTQLELTSNGQHLFLVAGQQLSPDVQVVLANGTIESTRLALESFPLDRKNYAMGANFSAHLRTNLIVRVKRSALGLGASSLLEQGGALVRGEIANPNGTKRRYHLQVLASAEKGDNPESTMWTMFPDIELFRNLLANQSPDWITIVLRGLGEMDGDQLSGPGSVTSFVTLANAGDSSQVDEAWARRAWVNFAPTQADFAAWRSLAQAAVDVAAKLGGAADIQYLYGGKWNDVPPADPFAATKDKLGNTHHEGGTLWIGDAPATSITDASGRFHHIENAYVAGPALFPTLGSANPSLTALTLARKTAAAVVEAAKPAQAAAFKTLYTGSLQNWQMAGSGGFLQVFDILETRDGPGLLWYTREAFEDFVLELDWQCSARADNSGVFIRFPSLSSSDPTKDVNLAIEQGYEIQIDPRGFNPETGAEGDPLHSTGAIYKLQAPARLDVAKGPWQWNRFSIEAIGNRIKVTLNGVLITDFVDPHARSLRGHIGLQNHHGGSKVQFRNIQIKAVSSAAPIARRSPEATRRDAHA